MMKLTRSCGCALHALEYLAARAEGTPVASHHIAQARGVPEPFLRKVLSSLTSAGLLRSLKGPNGGYALARPAARITLLEVVEVVDGPIRAEAPLAQARWAVLDSRLGAVCQEVADLVRRRLGAVRLSDLAGKT
jgi:Rrf2 family protein